MQKTHKLIFLFLFAVILSFPFGKAVLAATTPQIQTSFASSIQGTSVSLSANVTDLGAYSSANVYFQWGTDTSYGSQTPVISQSYVGFLTQSITGLSGSTTYHFRAVAQNIYGAVYGQDVSFVTGPDNGSSIIASVQTAGVTYVSNFQATLNGLLSNANPANTNYVYFQWGTTTNYGTETPLQSIGYAQTFSQSIANLNASTTYHFRAVVKGIHGTVYGQDMVFNTTGNGSYGNSALFISKKVSNLTSGNLSWQASVGANPSDIVSFAITLQPNNQDIHNVLVRDILPAGLKYFGNLIVDASSNYTGDINSGVNIGTITAGQPVVVSYQAQVLPAVNFNFGATTLTNNATVTSQEAGTQTASASVVVNKSVVYGASTVAAGPSSVSTGLTNNFLTDSFLLPLLIIALGLWFYFSGWLDTLTIGLKSKGKK